MPKFHGIDLNGLSDSLLTIDWPDRLVTNQEWIKRPAVIRIDRARTSWISGAAAALHPGDRGWVQPAWSSKSIERMHVARLMQELSGESHAALPGLTEHLRSITQRVNQATIAVADDFTAEAQALLLDAASRASHFVPGRGRVGWRPLLVWRSVAAAFNWGPSLDAQTKKELRGKTVNVLSILEDRVVCAQLEIDFDDNADGILITPVRSAAGRGCGAGEFPPQALEASVTDGVMPDTVRRQLQLLALGSAYVSGEKVDTLLQDDKGRWISAPDLKATPEMRIQSQQKFRDLVSESCQQAADITLVESPDHKRGTQDCSWFSCAVEHLQRKLSAQSVVGLPERAVALGCAEYTARLNLNLPTFFDYLPQIEIAAADPQDQIEFVALLPGQRRVAGNSVSRSSLSGFQVPASATHLEFYLFKEVDRQMEDVRRSRTELPTKPEAAVHITLNVEQRPVSGHAVIDATPDYPGAFNPGKITLDWRQMQPTGKSRTEILEQLNRERPRGYPNAPTPLLSHWAVWDALKVKDAIQQFLAKPAGRSAAYESAVDDLRTTLARRSNPRFTGLDPSVDESLHAFGSDGAIPTRLGQAGAALIDALRKKVDADLKSIGRYAYAKQTVRRLCIAGAWMFEACPEQVLEHFRSILVGGSKVGMLTDAIGRSVSGNHDVDLAFAFLARRIAAKRQGPRIWQGAGKDLKAVANILRFRPESARRLKRVQATLFVECALATMEQGLIAQKGLASLQQNFLWAATTFLLALRYRMSQSDFIAPPVRGAVADPTFLLASEILRKAEKIDRNRRSVHRLVPATVAHATEFLNKTGGDPNIINRIMQELDEEDDT